jgi:hypothetical protein
MFSMNKKKARSISRVSSMKTKGAQERERARERAREEKRTLTTLHYSLVSIEINIKKTTRIVEIDDIRAHQ